ncbi:MAG TPA: heavy metal translocating P-type ATPase [Kofleriaceae bacterium]|jgi:Cu+-exporting ATPase
MPSDNVIELPVLGMTCAACVRRVEKAIGGVAGVASADVNLVLSRARIEFDAASVSALVPTTIADAIRKAGYEVPADALDGKRTGRARLDAIADAADDDIAALKRDMIIALALSVPLLVVAMTHGRLPIGALPSTIIQLALGSLVVLGPGRRYFRTGIAAVLHGSPDMNTLIALGAGAAWLSSLVPSIRWLAAGTYHHAPMLYFEAGAAIIAFVLIGKVLEARARSRVADAVRGLLSLAPVTAHEIFDEAGAASVRDVDAASLAAGASIVVRPGERVPADGTIIEGSSALDESMLTGESLPVDKTDGSPVYAGTLNHHGALTVRVARAGSDTTLAAIARAVEDAQGQKPPIAQLADRIAARFVPAVLLVALVTFAIWALRVDASFALERAIAVLVIACPCALGLATPAAIAVATSRGAELGILFRSGAALERGSEVTVIALDKTGTLTEGAPRVTRVVTSAATSSSSESGLYTMNAMLDTDVLRFAAAAEQASEHPLARAIVAAARQRGLSLPKATDVVVTPGAGIRARVDGRAIAVGSGDAFAKGAIIDAEDSGSSIAHVLIDDRHVGYIAISDAPRSTARDVVEAIRALDVKPVLITGDRDAAARALAAQVGIELVHSEVSPTQKAAIVEGLRDPGARGEIMRGDVTGTRRRAVRVAMVGDGINDAPALAVADLGIALASGTDIAAAAADVTLVRGGISNVSTALRLCRATMTTIRRNLVAAFAYNIICIPIAAGVLYPLTGWLLSPVLASAAMSLSSVSVLLSSLRLRRFT